ncbi:MAG TPA: ECF transporter S component [Syntrophomonadaceae bacterium]|nr:ECF transporter S component [Syntrophomonadaceae bacterium]
MKLVEKVKQNFTMMSLLLIPVAIGINLVGGAIAMALKLPIYLDCIGTILTAVLAGPWVAVVAGALSSVVATITIDPISLPFGLVQIAIALMAGYLANKGLFETVLKTIISGVILAVTAAVVASPIVAYLFGGVTSAGSAFIVGYLLATGKELLNSVFTAQIITDSADKILSSLVVFAVVRSMPERFKIKFRG